MRPEMLRAWKQQLETEPVNENETIRMNVYGAMTTVCASARLM